MRVFEWSTNDFSEFFIKLELNEAAEIVRDEEYIGADAIELNDHLMERMMSWFRIFVVPDQRKLE